MGWEGDWLGAEGPPARRLQEQYSSGMKMGAWIKTTAERVDIGSSLKIRWFSETTSI